MLSANFKPKRTAAASRGFLATARISSLYTALTLRNDGTGSPGHRVSDLAGSGRVTGQYVRPGFDPVLSFNMCIYRGVISTE